jgi:hypothetical protein
MRDKKIGRRPLELEALLQGRVKAFALVQGTLPDTENAQILVRALPRILNLVAATDFPFIARVHKDSTVELWKWRAGSGFETEGEE